jgi:hypothetical protein
VAGELRRKAIGSDTFVLADIDGDAVADFEIELGGSVTLSAADFLL